MPLWPFMAALMIDYAANYGISHSINRRNRWLRAPATNIFLLIPKPKKARLIKTSGLLAF
jgi:hypothetical protein